MVVERTPAPWWTSESGNVQFLLNQIIPMTVDPIQFASFISNITRALIENDLPVILHVTISGTETAPSEKKLIRVLSTP